MLLWLPVKLMVWWFNCQFGDSTVSLEIQTDILVINNCFRDKTVIIGDRLFIVGESTVIFGDVAVIWILFGDETVIFRDFW